MEPTLTKHIELHDNRDGQPRAFIAGTRVRVQDIYVESEIHGRSPDEIVAALPHLSMAQVHAALSYCFEHRQEILDEVRQDERLAAEARAAIGPGPLERKLQDTGGEDDAVSS